MTKKDAVGLASRVVAIYLLLWAFDSATYLPARFFSLAHHSTALSGGYFADLDRVEIMEGLVRIAALLILSLLFFRGGPAVQRLLSVSDQSPQAPAQQGFQSTNT